MLVSITVIVFTTLIYGLIHSGLASLEAKALARGWWGPATDRWYRLAYNLFAAVSLLPVLALPALFPDRRLYAIPFPWVLLTLAGQALAAAALLVGVVQTGAWTFLGIQQVFHAPASEPHRLVATGLYRYVRHPLYTAGLVFIWLSPVMTANLLTLYVGFTAYLIIGAWFEERKLLREFGEAYADYKKRTPMLIPYFHRPKRND